MPGYGPGDGYGGMDGFGNTGGSQSGQNSGNKGDTSTDSSPEGQMSGVVDSRGNPVGYGEKNSLGNFTGTVMSANPAFGQNQRNLARSLNALQMNAIRSEPSLGMGDYSPSTMGGLNATDGLSFGESMGYNAAGIKDAIGNMGITKGGIMGSAIAAMLGLGPFAGIALGQIGKSYSEKPEGEPGFFGQLGQNVRSDLSSMFGKAPEGEKRSLMDRLGLSGLNIGPADPNVDDKGGNREPVMQELATMDVATIERDNIIKEYIAKGYPPDMAEYLYEALHANA